MNATSRYQISEIPNGIRIEGEDRPPVEVIHDEYALEVRYVTDAGPVIRERFGLFNFGKMLDFVARGLMREWHPADGWHGARAWAQQQTARAIARRLREHWCRLLGRSHPTVLAVQRAVFAATFSDASLTCVPALYKRDYLIRDVLRFPAAAVALRNAHDLHREFVLNRLHRSQPARELRELAQNLGLSLHLCALSAQEPDITTLLDRLEDWKSLFSDTGTPYRSLNRTLMNLPGRVPHRLICNLRKTHLERPVTQRLELMAIGLYTGIRSDRDDGGERRADHTALFLRATADQVRAAIERVSKYLRQPLDVRRTADVRQAIYFLSDFPETHHGTLPGLAEKASRWHREQQRHQVNSMRQRYGADTPTATPPIPLPDAEGVRFLQNVGDVCAEAEHMQHCVASYIDLAVDGNCYLFHVSHKGEEATVEVGIEGQVRQSQGPRNQRNQAAAYGKRVLNAWAKTLPVLATKALTLTADDIPF